MNSLLHSVRQKLRPLLPQPKAKHPLISSYGQIESGLSLETIQPVMEWFFLSLFNAGYFGKAHLFWMQSQTDPALEKQARQFHRRGEPILGYRCGDRVSPAPSGFYWRMMPEHPSMRVYQLEIKHD
ncbi:MAG TPA: hypothetical protein V6C84_12200 [Coleofasciculaceae cyanobacterium]|jgi:hypothetical protein